MNTRYKHKLVLIGGGGHCASCIDVIELEDKYEIVGIIDNDNTVESICGYPIIGNDSALPVLASSIENALITVGQISSPASRTRLYEMVSSLGFNHPTIVSPRAYVSKYAHIGRGTIIMHDALVNTRAAIGNNCIINSKALIEHDAIIEDNCHISTGSIVNGGAVIRRGTFIGSNTTTVENAVGKQSDFIKAGSLFKGAVHE